MNYKKCVYFVEGPCEKQLIEVLNKQHPYRLSPGRVNVLNPIQALIPRSTITGLMPGTEVVYVFDTDVEKTEICYEDLIESLDMLIGNLKDYTIEKNPNELEDFKFETDCN